MPVFINNFEITDDEVHEEMQHHPAPTIDDARRDASRALIVRHLLLDAAVERKLLTADELNNTDEDKEELIIEQLLKDVIQLPDADEETCKRYYRLNTSRFKDHTTSEMLPFSMVKEHIKSYMEDKGHQAAFNAYVDSLMDKVNIVGMT